MHFHPRLLTFGLLISAMMLSACSITGGIADALSDSVLNQDDPEIVRDGAPTLMLLIDGMIQSDPDDEDILLAGAKLYGAYASAFVTDQVRAQRMANKALEYARRALCEELDDVCATAKQPLDVYQRALNEIDDDDIEYLYGFASAWAGWIQANSSDWTAIADLPKVNASMQRIVALDDAYDTGTVHLYLGVLNTQLPASLGGKPEAGRQHFEKAIAISQGRNLMAKVLYAKNYARLVFNRTLHDQLLREVLAADPNQPGMTLINALAQQQAKVLFAESETYF